MVLKYGVIHAAGGIGGNSTRKTPTASLSQSSPEYIPITSTNYLNCVNIQITLQHFVDNSDISAFHEPKIAVSIPRPINASYPGV